MSTPKTLSPGTPNVTLTGLIHAYGSVATVVSGYTIDAAVVGFAPTNFTIHNSGTIISQGTNAYYGTGLFLGASGTVFNSGTIIAGNGIFFDGYRTSSLSNTGEILGTLLAGVFGADFISLTNSKYIFGKAAGVLLLDGGNIDNAAKGTIIGTAEAIFSDQIVTITNAGTLRGEESGIEVVSGTVKNTGLILQTNSNSNYGAVESFQAGTVTNAGLIEGGNGIKLLQVFSPTSAALVTNTGLISASSTVSLSSIGFNFSFEKYGVGIYSEFAGSVNNQGDIYGNHAGIVFNKTGSVTNSGLISSSFGYGIQLDRGGVINNAGTIYGYAGAIYNANGYNPATGSYGITNSGLISAYKPNYAYASAIAQRDPGTINNSGKVYDPNANAIVLNARYAYYDPSPSYGTGAIINSGTVDALYGLILAGSGGVYNTGTIITQNAGVQIRRETGVYFFNSGNNLSRISGTAQIYNSGLIAANGTDFTYNGTSYAAAAIMLKRDGAVTNVTNAATGTISAPNGIGILVQAGGTVTNFGTIAGGAYAIYFAPGGANRLIINSTSTLIGTVNLNGGAFEFAAGPGIGTFAPESLQVLNAGSITIDTGAVWDIAGTFTNGTTGILLNDGTIKETTHDLIDFNGPIIGTGVIDLSKKPLTFNNTVASTQTIAFTGTGETLALSDPKAFHAKIEDFKLGDTIDLTGVKLSAITATHFAKGILTISESSTKLEFTFANPSTFTNDTFKLTAAGHGTVITLAPSAALLPLTPTPTLAPLTTFTT